MFEEARQVDETSFLASILRKVYGWMAIGLALSGVIAWYTAMSGLGSRIMNSGAFMICIIAELVLVLALSWGIRKISAGVAFAMFLAYAALNGLTLSLIFFVYELGSIQKIFFLTAGMFGGMAIYGSVTKRDLQNVGAVFGMALWGIILLMLVNLFLRSERLDWAVSFVAVLVFTGLTAWDAQKVKLLASSIPSEERNQSTIMKLGVICALELYLDFVNLFLHLLRILGRRR
ncbi:MAG: Bax inhibitor-1/YccA family protein [Kiritimatiellae bacterium]|nr:Bax inhibitor-1/YccA family protein [Kiritimatiellia bacterium]